jgi:hypothetical protein
MQRPPTSRGGVGSYVLPAMLLVSIVVALLLTTRLFGRANAGAEFSVADPVGTACPAGAGVPSCASFDVMNVGRLAAAARCTLQPTADASATFADGGTVLETPAVLPGSTETLLVEVDAGKDDTVRVPLLDCEPVA